MDQEQKTGPTDNDNSLPQQRPKRPKEQGFEELRTLFLSGLPTDIKEREIHNLMRFFPGYEGCVLNLNEAAGRPVCFASFTDRNSALRALRVVQELRFDPNVAQTLRVEFAKTNSKARRLPPEFYAEKRRKAALAAAASPFFGYGSYNNPDPYAHPNMLVPWFQNMNISGRPGYPDTMAYPQTSFNAGQPPSPTPSQQPVSKVPPCTTLFVANLHPDVQERDLVRLFKITPGFRRLRLSLKDGVAICFVEYNDIQSSTHAMNTLQGFPVGPTSIRIEFARTRMGEAKGRTGQAGGGGVEGGEGDQSQNAPDDSAQSNEGDGHIDENGDLGIDA